MPGGSVPYICNVIYSSRQSFRALHGGSTAPPPDWLKARSRGWSRDIGPIKWQRSAATMRQECAARKLEGSSAPHIRCRELAASELLATKTILPSCARLFSPLAPRRNKKNQRYNVYTYLNARIIGVFKFIEITSLEINSYILYEADMCLKQEIRLFRI